jgi:AcrR family transcriptional regulator
MQRQRKEQGEQTRQAIIDVTTKLFAQRGYAGTSLDLIAKEAQTSKSSIFWHFENKEDLLFTVVDRAMSEWEVKAGSEILAQPDPPAQLAKLIALYRELAQDRPDTLRLLLGLLLETADVNEDVKKRFQRMYRGYRTSIQIVIEEGIAAGHFTREIPSAHLSALVLALFDGLFIQWFLDAGAVPEDIFDSLKRAVFALVMPREKESVLPGEITPGVRKDPPPAGRA